MENAVNGITDKMVGFERSYEDGQYVCKTKLLPLTDVANTEKKVPIEWINVAHNGVEKPFIDYVLPLIQGEPKLPKEDSLPRFATEESPVKKRVFPNKQATVKKAPGTIFVPGAFFRSSFIFLLTPFEMVDDTSDRDGRCHDHTASKPQEAAEIPSNQYKQC